MKADRVPVQGPVEKAIPPNCGILLRPNPGGFHGSISKACRVRYDSRVGSQRDGVSSTTNTSGKQQRYQRRASAYRHRERSTAGIVVELRQNTGRNAL